MRVSLSGFAGPPIGPPIWPGLHRIRCWSFRACLRKWWKIFVLPQRKPQMLFIACLRLFGRMMFHGAESFRVMVIDKNLLFARPHVLSAARVADPNASN
jgi:hypothetical protein